MHESTIFIYVSDPNFVVTQAQKDAALALFDSIVVEVEHEPCIVENTEFTLSDGDAENDYQLSSPFLLTAGALSGSNKYWLLNPDESADESDEDDYDEVPYGTELRPEVMQQLQEILGTKLQIAWRFDQ